MDDFSKIYDFNNLYKAHIAARKGKRNVREVIEFEMSLGSNLVVLSDEIKNGVYAIQGYYAFEVFDPKHRIIHALHYRDRVLQHCLCDEVLAPALDRRLIYDNAACRIGKGNRFALNRLTGFMVDFHKKHGTNGYFLKCDIRKFFDNINHDVLKAKLQNIFSGELFELLCEIVDSYEVSTGKGLPLGNQTSQWFALYYLDSFDRIIKEKLHIKHYTRYMDDCVLIHEDKDYLKWCLNQLQDYVHCNLGLFMNEKTAIFPIKNGVDYLGWHLYMTDTGKVIRKVRTSAKRRCQHKVRALRKAVDCGAIDSEYLDAVLRSYREYLSYGHTYQLRENLRLDDL